MDRRVFLAASFGLMASRPLASRPAMALPSAAPRRIKLHNAHTGESFDGPYRDEHGPIAAAMEDLSHLLRDHHSGERIAIEVGVVDFLAAVMDGVGASRATVLSAYRTVATNRMLAKTTFGVADNSQHIYGRALDIRLDSRLEDAMQAARGMQRGGVGWYPRSRFIHLDTGPVRNWTLDGGGFDGLLSRIEQLLSKSGLPKTIIAGRSWHPLGVRDRLTLQRAIAQGGVPRQTPAVEPAVRAERPRAGAIRRATPACRRAAPRRHDPRLGEQRGGLRGPLVGQTDDDDRPDFPPDLPNMAQQLRKRHIARAVDMTERPVEFVRAAHVENQRMLAATEPAAQIRPARSRQVLSPRGRTAARASPSRRGLSSDRAHAS